MNTRQVVLAFLLVAAGVRGDDPPNLDPSDLDPPRLTPPPELTEPCEPTPPKVKVEEPVVHGPLGPRWDYTEYLLWWLRPQGTPPLATRSANMQHLILGDPNARLVLGGRLPTQEHSGGRFVFGSALDCGESIGYEFGYMFLGTRSTTVGVASAGRPGDPYLARPFLMPGGAETAEAFAVPGILAGHMEAVASTRVQGAEINCIANWFDGDVLRFDGLAGFRFLQVHEGLRIGVRTTYAPDFGLTVIDTVDQIDGHNRFFGGQVGFRADLRRGPAFIEFIGKVALGQTQEVVKIGGVTAYSSPYGADALPTAFYAANTNSGRATQSVFAVMPEASVRFGWSNDHQRWFIGYNFLYLSRVVRPGDQIERVLPHRLVTIDAIGLVAPSDNPARLMRQSDFWAQGLMLGWELRY